ncbi:hypothetical protein ACIHIX_34910 [Streptomyces sp. NPDC051913]|uniref:hypothetical protein n=1 Tax=Streptomyces sp. NPDC051913 TaxID=3365676 RepID=UPI0037D59C19
MRPTTPFWCRGSFERFAAGHAQAAFARLDEQVVWSVSGRPDLYPSAGNHGKADVIEAST